MSLISCPECNRKISDKAVSCPHCGFPLNNNVINNEDKNRTYNIIISASDDNRIKTIRFLRETKGLGIAEAKQLIDNLPNIIFNNISLENAEKVKKTLVGLGNKVEIKENTSIDEMKTNAFNENESISNYYEYQNKPLLCPRCGSTAITTGQRGFSLLFGFLGSNKTVNRCGKCGYSWEPKT